MVLRYADVPERLNVTSYFVDQRLAEGSGDRVALRLAEREVTYRELAELVNRTGNVLVELGVRRGDRVLIAVSDSLEFVAAWYAVQKIGAVSAEVYTFLPAKDYAAYLAYTGAVVAVVDSQTLPKFRAVTGDRAVRLLVVGADPDLQPGEFSFTALASAADPTLTAAPTTRDDVTIWKFTTGSTGAPKACTHPTRSPLVSFQNYARELLDIQPDDIVLPVPKLFFGYARDLATLFPFGVGGSGVVFPERSTPDRLFELIAAHRPTILVNVPTMMAAMLAHPEAANQDLSCVRVCTSAGEALPAELHRKWDNTFGVEVVDGIGSSEAYHIFLSNRPGAARRGSLGRAVPGYRARAVDEYGENRPDGEIGVLEVTGGTTALEYFGKPEQSRATFHGDTISTGDLVSRDADGYFYYHGRADNLLKVGGIWVAPSEIENCLLAHPAVVECAVLGYTEAELVLPVAVVVLRKGSPVSTEDIQDFVRARLSPHKCPRAVRFVDALPKTPNSKLDRRALRALPALSDLTALPDASTPDHP